MTKLLNRQLVAEMHHVGELIISLMDCHGEEEGGLFRLVENDNRQLQHHPQTSDSAADSHDTSADSAQLVETAHNDRVHGQQASCQLKERSEKLSQLQKSNDKSQCMRFPTIWYVRPAKPQISLRIRTV